MNYSISDNYPPRAKDDYGKAEALFTYIRNSLAHGNTYFIENGKVLLEDKNETVQTAMILTKQRMLLDWISLIDSEERFIESLKQIIKTRRIKMGKVNVVIVDATGNKEQKVGLPDDIKCGIIMVKLVEKIKLPSVGPDGNPISYKFIHKVTGRQLLEAQTLGEAGIKDGDVLRLQPEITAGGLPYGK